MNPLLRILLYVVTVLAVAVFLSPPIYWGCQYLIELGWLDLLRGFPFHRYFSRTLQVTAIILAIPLVWSLRIRELGQLGLARDPRRIPHLLLGLLCALIPLALLAAGYFWTGTYAMKPSPDWSKLGRIALTAGAVGIFEEIFFRGILLGLAVRSLGAGGGIALTTAVFAGVHFLRPAKLPDAGPVTWLSGWDQLQQLWANIPPWPLVGYGMLTLIVAGWILALATRQTRSLWPAIGLHAGWVFGQQTLLNLAKFQARPPEAWLPQVGPNLVSGAVPTGWVPLLAVLLGGWVLLRSLRRLS